VLTVTEFGLLRTLAGFPGKVYTREELMEKGYAYDNVVSGRTIDSHVRRLRQKFATVGGEPIETVHGLGYQVGPCAGWAPPAPHTHHPSDRDPGHPRAAGRRDRGAAPVRERADPRDRGAAAAAGLARAGDVPRRLP